jgi:glycosyltransferase involved in cell wall biosynthesis
MIIGADRQASPTGLTAVMPVFNEIDLCEDALRRLHNFLTIHFPDFEVIVVESGSTDGTAEVCDRLAQELINVQVIHETSRNGMGSAMRLGYTQASKPFVFLVTADIPFPLETLSRAVPLLNQHDCVLSFRDEDSRGFLRKLQSVVYVWLIKRTLGLRMRSVNSAFKLIPTDFVQSLSLESTGWFLDAEVLYWITQRKLRFAEIPVPLVDRTAGVSKVGLGDWVATVSELVEF